MHTDPNSTHKNNCLHNLRCYHPNALSKCSGMCGQINSGCDSNQNDSRKYLCLLKVKGNRFEEMLNDQIYLPDNQF